MRYPNIVRAEFLDRPNRFTAHVRLEGQMQVVHVKNTGRCRELLVPGAEVYLTEPGTPGRKTRYDLVAVRKGTGALFNIDSQAPNRVAAEWLAGQGYDRVIPEYRYGDSRIDFCLERDGRRTLLEVKGCTLEREGVGYFPDAPTQRGVKHLRELAGAAARGYGAAVLFVIQTDGVTEVRPNTEGHPEFASALEQGVSAGVRVLFLACSAEPDGLYAGQVRERGVPEGCIIQAL